MSFDFATSVIPGWHTTIFPPYFVAGAIFGGFAMVLTLMIPARAIYRLHDLITPQHIDNMAKIILLTGSIVGYAYIDGVFHRVVQRQSVRAMRVLVTASFGPYWWALLGGHDDLQRRLAAGLLVQECRAQPLGRVSSSACA